jgi:hypothetical protein
MEERDPLTHLVIGVAIEVHREMGPGLLESVYQRCMEQELSKTRVGLLINFNVPVLKDGIKRLVH